MADISESDRTISLAQVDVEAGEAGKKLAHVILGRLKRQPSQSNHRAPAPFSSRPRRPSAAGDTHPTTTTAATAATACPPQCACR
jgi:hypothetical protein